MKKYNLWFCFILLIISSVSLSSSANSSDSAGTVITTQGKVQLIRNGKTQLLKRKDKLLKGDRIITDINSRIKLLMPDNATLTLGSGTDFLINQYQYSEINKTGSARIELLKGVMRAVTGAIGKTQERDFLLSTPVATIGIRGTDFWVGDIFSSAFDIALISGKGVYIQNTAGRVEIENAGYGSSVKNEKTLPSQPRLWGKKKFNAALDSVTLNPL